MVLCFDACMLAETEVQNSGEESPEFFGILIYNNVPRIQSQICTSRSSRSTFRVDGSTNQGQLKLSTER